MKSIVGYRVTSSCCILAAFCMSPAVSAAQEVRTAVTFDALYNVSGANFLGRSIEQTSDGGYIAVGVQTTTVNDILVMKLDAGGSVSWQNTYDVNGQFSDGYLVRQTTTGYIVVAVLEPPEFGPDVLLLLSLDPAGNLLWRATYPTGGEVGALPSSIEQVADGGYLLGAINYDSHVSAAAPLWALRLDADGNVVWQKVFGFLPGSIHATADGGYILAGSSLCTPTCTPWIVKLDDGGNVTWQKQYLIGSDRGFAGSARQTADGGYLVAGSYNPTPSRSIALLMKLDANGNLLWQQGYASGTCVAGIGAYDAQPAAGAGYDLMLNSPCVGAVVIAKLDAKAQIRWADSPAYAPGNLVLLTDRFTPTRDGGYIATGSVGSLRLPVHFMALKADGQGSLKTCSKIIMTAPQLTAVSPPATRIGAGNIGIAATTVVPGNVAISAATSQLSQSNGCKL